MWRFDARGTNQTLAQGERWGTGLRNMVAFAVNNGALYGVQHGRDQLFEHWPQSLAPEYGGDGALTVGPQGINCADYTEPLAVFGAHWAPNGLHFYQGRQFPARYRGGAFVAFHGGFDRAPLPNEGYTVAFVPFGGNGTPSGPFEIFADGFAGPLDRCRRTLSIVQ